ncbi:aspartyl protease family protein [Alteromonas sp. LOR]|nr:aspartyl protease family protein [Alteromonas sp. LOR]
MNANNDIKPIWKTAKPKKQTLAAHYIGEKPYIKLKVDKQQELLFLIDTGASFTMLFDTPNTSKIEFEKGYSLSVGGWGEGANTPAYQTQLSRIEINDVSFENVNVAYIPISTSQYYLREDEAIFDGVIGHDLLKHFVWTFDKRSQTISLSAKSSAIQEKDVVLPFKTSLSKISIPSTVYFNEQDSVSRSIVIDTGSRHYMKMNTAYADKNNIKLPPTSISAADFGLSGKAPHRRVTLPALKLGDLKLSRIKTNIIESDDEDDWWILGSALLNQFITIIDYPNRQFIIRPYSDVEFKTQYNLAGLDLRKLRGGKLMVRYVYPQLPGEAAAIEAGDVVTTINDKHTESISEEDWLLLASEPGNFTLCFENGGCKNFQTRDIEGYSRP